MVALFTSGHNVMEKKGEKYNSDSGREQQRPSGTIYTESGSNGQPEPFDFIEVASLFFTFPRRAAAARSCDG